MLATDYSKCRLSIQFSLSGFSFVVFNAINNELIVEKETLYPNTNNFIEWLKIKLAGESFFRENYLDIRIYWLPHKYTTVPKALFNTQRQQDIFNIVHPIKDDELLKTEEESDIVLLYTIEASLYQLIKDYFPKGDWQIPLLQEKNRFQTDKEWLVYFLIFYKEVYITLWKNGKLQLCNNYYFQTKDDLLYYTLYTFDNLDIPVAQSSILFNGHMPYIEMMQKEISKYHNTISIINNPYKIETKKPISNFLLTI